MALCIAGGTKRPMFVLNCTFNREHNKQWAQAALGVARIRARSKARAADGGCQLRLRRL